MTTTHTRKSVALFFLAVCLASAQHTPEQNLGSFDYDWYGAVSPDGRRLTYVQWETGDLVVRDLQTGEVRNLTNKKGRWESDLPPAQRKEQGSNAFAVLSAISPDSQRVAFAWFDENQASLRVIGLDGTELRILHSDPSVISYEPHDWSPDGQHILVTLVRRNRPSQNVLLSVADGGTRRLRTLKGPHPPLRMQFSPDGRYIAFDLPQGNPPTSWDLFVMHSNGSNLNRITGQPGNELLVDWSPDGKGLVFVKDEPGRLAVWMIPVSAGKAAGSPKLMRDDIGPLLFPIGLTRDGSLFYGRALELNEMYLAEIDPESGKVVGSPVLLGEIGGVSAADWSPDGKSLVYPVRIGPIGGGYVAYSWALVIRSLESERERIVPVPLSRWRPFQPRWSPDGRSVVATGWDAQGLAGVYQINIKSGRIAPLAQQRGRGDSRMFNPQWPSWSPDGGNVFYHRVNGGRLQIVAHTVETGEEKELVGAELPDARVGAYAISPDGSQLAFWSGRGQDGQVKAALKVMPSAGGEPRDLLEVQPEPGTVSHLTWTPDRRHLIFGKRHSSGERHTFELWRIAVAGGEPQKLGVAMQDRFLAGLSISPDGRRLVFTAHHRYRSELWRLERLLDLPPYAR